MKLGLQLGYWTTGPDDPIELVLEAERLGFDSVWTAEAYGSDCFSPLCWLGSRTSVGGADLGALLRRHVRAPGDGAAAVWAAGATLDRDGGGDPAHAVASAP